MFDPFRGWLYDAERVPDRGRATSPPYDVISAGEREDLLARSPHNIVRLLLPGSDPADYERAGALLNEWRRSGILAEDPTARFYLYVMDYTDAGGVRRTARGVVGALALLPLGEKVIPHEETMGKHRRDRTAILDATKANLDPIIGLSAAPQLPGLLTTPEVAPRLSFTEDDDSHHRLYDISDAAAVAGISEAVAAHPVSIADGHHRYTTALAYGTRMTETHGAGPWQSIMAMVAPAEGSGLTIGPYHRVLRPLRIDESVLDANFDVTPAAPKAPTSPGTLVLVAGDRSLLLEPRPEALAALPAPWRAAGAAVARELLYPLVGADEEGAEYTADADTAVARAGEGRIGVLVSPIPEAAVAEAGEMGLRFPTKSTYFTPKPRAGLVVRCFRAVT